MKQFSVFPLIFTFAVFFMAGCGDDVAEDRLDEALMRFERSMNRMINSDKDPFESGAYFSQANSLFKESMSVISDSTRLRTAHMGAGITEILKLNEDKELKTIKTRFENFIDTSSMFKKSSVTKPAKTSKRKSPGLLDFRLSPFSSNFSTGHEKSAAQLAPIMKVAMANPPLISEVQDVIRRKVIPAINYAVDRLIFVQGDPNYFFKVTPLMQGSSDADTLEMDMTEIKALHAGLLTLRSTFRILNAYNLDVPNYSVTSIVQVLNKPSGFLKLYSTHELGGARTDIMESADTLIGAIRFLRKETDPQDNDIIKIDTTFLDSNDFNEIENRLQDIKQGLISNVIIRDVNDYGDSVKVSIKNFFTNPVADFKEKMPDYKVLLKRTDCGDYPVWKFLNTTFPDHTFNGIFPEITSSDEFKRIFDIELDTVGITSMTAQVDGSLWNACDSWGEWYDGMIWISGERGFESGLNEIEDHISLNLSGIQGPGTFLFGGASGNQAHYCRYINDSYNRWETNATNTGTITITRLDNDIIAGTFSFTGYSYYNSSAKTFSSGSFYVRNEEDSGWLRKKSQEAKDAAFMKKK